MMQKEIFFINIKLQSDNIFLVPTDCSYIDFFHAFPPILPLHE